MENRFTKAQPRPLAIYYLESFHRAVEVKPKKVSKVLFPGLPNDHRQATYTLAAMAYNKAKAINAQTTNQVAFMRAYELACSSLWESLPEYARERWKDLPETIMHRIHNYCSRNYSALPGSDYEDDFANAEPEEEVNFPPGMPIPTGEA